MGNSHFIPWLKKQLQLRDIKADAPEMPLAYAPDYAVWSREFERFDVTTETVLVGHSCGAGFLVRWLSEHRDVSVAKVILVAPWLNTKHEHETTIFDFTIDPELTLRQSIIVFESTDDMVEIQDTVTKLRTELPNIHYVTFEKHGHFCERDIGKTFPELLNEVIR
jgi:predicted alpha/beta hydrolase family esterase